MLRKAVLQGLLLAAGLTGTLAASAAGMLVEGPSLVAGAPFSGVVGIQSVTTFADGNRIVRTNTVRYFRDGQGRTRTERQGLNVQGIAAPGSGGLSTTIMINDPVSGQRLNLFPKVKMAVEFKFQDKVISPAAAVSAADEGTPPFALLGIGMAIGANELT